MSGADRANAASRSGTLIFTRAAVSALMTTADWLAAAEAGFRAAAEGTAAAVPPLAVETDEGSFHAKAARLNLDRDYVALKFNGNFPANPERHGMPTIQGALLLCDGKTGALLAIIDSIELTLRRTAAATALAARHLARPDSTMLTICGCGAQAMPQLEAVAAVLPIKRCFAWDRDFAAARRFAEMANRSGGIDVEAVAELAGAAPASDVIITCTTAREPFLTPEHVRPGAFVAAVGADSPSKNEIAPELMRKALTVPDSLDQCAAMGDLHHAIRAGLMRREDVHAELADLVAGRRPGRTAPDQIAIFDSTGTALQDVAAAMVIYERAGTSHLRRVALGEAL